MGRERRPQTGSSNFSVSGSLTSLHAKESEAVPMERHPKPAPLRVSTHKLIHAGEKHSEPKYNNQHIRHIKHLSTWRVNEIDPHDHSTEHRHKFDDPAHRVHVDNEGKFTDMVGDENKQSIRNQALEKLCKIAKLRFGNTSNMFKAFKKRFGDTISHSEFVENIRKRNLDTQFTGDDIRLIYDNFDNRNEGIVDVGAVIKRAEEIEVLDTVAKRDMLEIRAFLADELEKRRRDKQLAEDSDVREGNPSKGAKTKTIRTQGISDDSEDLMKKAIGQKTFDLDVGTEELDHVLDEVFHKEYTKESHSKFARFLRLTNLKLNHVPFYIMRTNELNNLKQRAQSLEEQCANEETLGRLKQLNEKRKPLFVQPNFDPDAAQKSVHALSTSKSLPQLRASTPAPYQSERQIVTPRRAMSPMFSSRNDQLGEISTARYHEPILQDTSYFDQTCSSMEDFAEPVVLTEAKKSKLQNISSFSFEGSPLQSSGMQSSSEFSRDNLNSRSSMIRSRMGLSMGYDDLIVENVDRQQSMTSHYFGSEANLPDTRKEHLDRERKRIARQERAQKNLEITKDRIEYDNLKSHVQALRANQFRNEDTIRYQTAIFLNDMKCFKKQPLQVMAKKPDFTRSDWMWGGNMRESIERPDDRDFTTTYNNSFHKDGYVNDLKLEKKCLIFR